MQFDFDTLVIGAGLAGATAARCLAEYGGRRVLVVEQRDHIAGNAYDCLDSAGILIHRYGPHIFHTNEERVFRFLTRFTDWREYQHCVVANVHGQLMPVPFNLHSLYIAFEEEKAARLEQKLLDTYGAERKVTILELRQATDPDLSELADYVYENIFVHYTMKQWGTTPEQIDPATTARVPVFLSRDDRYFQDEWQGIPARGYTPMVAEMLHHPNITVQPGTDARTLLTPGDGHLFFQGEIFDGTVIYTGAVDELFACRFGRLPYRTLDFQFETLPMQWYQTCATVNYTVDQPYTRITEFKHLTGQVKKDCTTIVRELPRAYTGAAGEIPYYAIISPENNALYQKYEDLARRYPGFHLLGRLAEYKYYNMDAIVSRALSLCETLLG